LGLQSAFTPLTPCSRTPFLAAVGKPFQGVAAVDGEPKVMKRIKIGFTFDHRYIDGYHSAKIARRFTKIFENPETHSNIFNPLH
jgi:pyruvate/2-oxoglutarate dehydrogenase complex dihydrolipoamide acyltransferase (E2) component